MVEFLKHDFHALIVDSAGCSAFMKEYAHLFSDDEQYSRQASLVATKTKDVTEFLSEAGFKLPQRSKHLRVTYHEACHLVHTQKISKQPKDIIHSVPGIDVIELPEATWCCGSAGLYNAVRVDDSVKLLERKMKNIRSTDAEIVVTANPGCHLQLQYGIQKFGLKLNVVHPVSLLRDAYREPAVDK